MTTFFRRYLQTHHWITFRADLSPAPATLWVLLGEARSKCEHMAGVPLQPQVSEELSQMYLIKGVMATAAIEGNTLTEKEIEKHIQGELEVPPSREYQKKEVDNLLTAFNNIAKIYYASGPNPALNPEKIRAFNHTILKGLKLEDGCIPGEYRRHEAGVGRYKAAPPEDLEFLVDSLCKWLEDIGNSLKDYGIGGALIQAMLAHLYIEWIHPFGDGNGRTGRLVEFFILVNAGVPIPSAHLLSDYYNQTRPEYYRQLARASESGGQIIPFIQYALTGFVEELRKQLEFIRYQQWGICWRDYINERFENLHSSTHIRRRHLVLDLARRKDGATKEEIKGDLTPRVARHYAKKTDRTLSRDLNELCEAGLIAKKGDRYLARFDLIYAFLPPQWRKDADSRTT